MLIDMDIFWAVIATICGPHCESLKVFGTNLEAIKPPVVDLTTLLQICTTLCR